MPIFPLAALRSQYLELALCMEPGTCSRWLHSELDEATFVADCVTALEHAEYLGADLTRAASWFFSTPQLELGDRCLADEIARGRLQGVLRYLRSLSAGAIG